MKLYAIVGSPNSRKVLAVIDHLGLELEIEYLDLSQGDCHKPDYQALNPNEMVPLLIDDDLKLWESNAITQYLVDSSVDQTLFPRDLKQRADIARWQFWELAHFNNAFGTLSFESVAKPNFMQMQGDQGAINRSIDQLNQFANVLNEHMRDRLYVVGDAITIADYSIINVEFFKQMIPFDWSPYPHLNDYFDRIRQSEHWLATAPKDPSDIGKIPNR
ncbi:MAG: glutathione S-transferase family protein [Pseudomonadales bacterium]|nr:glutathione S-transferase family protein [Pseudomonadales bacterium]